MQDYNLGPSVSIGAVGDKYDSTATYAVGDYCIYDDKLYKCNTAISTAEAWNASHWTDTTIAEVLQTIPSVVDNLTTDDGTKALSAKQGKTLNDKFPESFSGTTVASLVQYVQAHGTCLVKVPSAIGSSLTGKNRQCLVTAYIISSEWIGYSAVDSSGLQYSGYISTSTNAVTYTDLNDKSVTSKGVYTGNANSLFTNGIYRSTTGSITGCPQDDGTLIVFNGEGNSTSQLFISSGSTTYTRVCWGYSSTTWTYWQKLAKLESVEVDLSGTVVDQPDSGWYYKEVNISNYVPSEAKIVSIGAYGSWDASVFYIPLGNRNISVRCPTSRTLGSNRIARIWYTL